MDKVLAFFSFSTSHSTLPEKFNYFAAIVFIIALLVLVINLLYKVYYKDNFWTCGTTLLIIVVLAAIVVYWVAAKIPNAVYVIWPMVSPPDISN